MEGGLTSTRWKVAACPPSLNIPPFPVRLAVFAPSPQAKNVYFLETTCATSINAKMVSTPKLEGEVDPLSSERFTFSLKLYCPVLFLCLRWLSVVYTIHCNAVFIYTCIKSRDFFCKYHSLDLPTTLCMRQCQNLSVCNHQCSPGMCRGECGPAAPGPSGPPGTDLSTHQWHRRHHACSG